MIRRALDLALTSPVFLVHFESGFSGTVDPESEEHAVKKTRYTEKQIAYAFKQAETGTTAAEVICRMGISEQTFYRWKKLYGGLGVGELRRAAVKAVGVSAAAVEAHLQKQK